MIYYELSDLYVENVSLKTLEDTLNKYTYIKFYAFIIHNRTENVKPHYHCMIQVDLNNKKAKSKIEKDLKDLKPFVKAERNPKMFARYFLHTDYIDKEKYDINEVITNNVNQFQDLYNMEIKKGKIENLLNEYWNYLICLGAIPSEMEIFKWFLERGNGNYFICHSKTLVTMAERLPSQDLYYQELERRLNVNDSCTDDINNYCIDNLV